MQEYIDWVSSWGPLILGHAFPAVVAAVLSYGSIVAIVNAVVSFYAINTILNLGTQQETGAMITAWGSAA